MTMLVFLHALLVFLHVLLVFIYSVGFGLNCTGGVLDFRGALYKINYKETKTVCDKNLPVVTAGEPLVNMRCEALYSKIEFFLFSDSFCSRIKGQAITPRASSIIQISSGYPTHFAHTSLHEMKHFLRVLIKGCLVSTRGNIRRDVFFGVTFMSLMRKRCKSTVSTVAALR